MKKASFVLLGLALMLTGCAKRQDNGLACTSVDCRPKSGSHQLVIWWQPELRNGVADFTQVTVNE
ncbi:HrpT family type III secretion system protein (plasmid) [Pantoea vagans]|uniref:HrpT family type III secretion system protein n=1 Tax=Pantoea vagans TaxID=470934 RepID=UPI003517020F